MSSHTAKGSIVLVMAFSSIIAGCSKPEDGESSGLASSSADYDFQIPADNVKLQRVDAMGVALTSTVLMNRDKDNENRYQQATPDVHKDPRTTLSFIKMLRRLHTYWRKQLDGLGFEPCSPNPIPLYGIPVSGLSINCTLQHFKFDEDPKKEGPRVIDAVIPDYITLDFDEPLRFPNGRPPWESISDKILAMGFLEMGGKCPGIDRTAGVTDEVKRRVPRNGDKGYRIRLSDNSEVVGVPLCTIETFVNIGLQVQANDRPFKEKTFPYLAEPWFYEKAHGEESYFWPTGKRLESPE